MAEGLCSLAGSFFFFDMASTWDYEVADIILGLRFNSLCSRIEPGLTRAGATPMSVCNVSLNVNGGANVSPSA